MPRSNPSSPASMPRFSRFGERRIKSRALRLLTAPPRGTGILLAVGLFLATGYYGLVVGAPVNPVVAALGTPSDMVANLCGFRIETVTIKGQKGLTDEEIMAAAGVTASSSLLMLDAEKARDGLQALPLVASATVHKLFPDTLSITVEERVPFALWQKDGVLHIISEDGVAIDEVHDGRFSKLPFVVGDGAAQKAGEIIHALGAVPDIQSRVRASVRVADRRWNLTMDNGVIVRLPEKGLDVALAALQSMQAKDQVLDKAILAVDLRLADRVVFRLTEEAALARAEELALAKKKKGAAT